MTRPLRQLDSSRIDVWYAQVAADLPPPQLARCRGLLDPTELARADRFLFERDRALFAVAHALVRTSLSRYAPRHPAEWRFVANRHGRPEIVAEQNPERLRFNLSHTRGLAACAVARDREIGIDVERLSRRDVSDRVAQRFFAPSEVALLQGLSAADRQQAFLNFWTLKESYIKARGMGLAIPLAQFWFSAPWQERVEIGFDPRLGDNPAQWQFERFRVADDFLLAVAMRTPPIEPALAVHVAEVADPGLLL
jgi:4'-phosphopantetheinyl transferase